MQIFHIKKQLFLARKMEEQGNKNAKKIMVITSGEAF
ncbi:MAG: hypothetical protein ACJAZP_000159 [Psychromonas sp.]|jgi:hypothetical protein